MNSWNFVTVLLRRALKPEFILFLFLQNPLTINRFFSDEEKTTAEETTTI
jgi:hypothetical protein